MSYLYPPVLRKSDILSDSTAFAGADIALIYAAVDTEVAAIKLKTDNLPSDPADESLIEAAITVAHATTNALVDDLETRLTLIRAGYLDNINNAQLLNIPNISTLTTTRIGYLDELGATNLPADIDTIKADTQVIEDATLKVTPTAGSLASFIATGGTALGTPLPASKSLYDTIVLDRLDNATYGLSAIETLVDDLEGRLTAARAGYLDILNTDSKYILSTALTAPTVDSLARFIASGGTGLGTVLPASKSLYDVIVLDRLSGAEYTGTVSAGTAVETTLKEIVTTTRTEIKSIWLDLNNLTANATIKLYHKIDATNYRVFEIDSWLFATDDKGVLITGFSINNDFKITITGTEGAGVNIMYNIIYQSME